MHLGNIVDQNRAQTPAEILREMLRDTREKRGMQQRDLCPFASPCRIRARLRRALRPFRIGVNC